MTNAEIIKALRCCIKIKCSECPLKATHCSEIVAMEYALDIINHQKAEIERLQKDLEEAAVTIHDAAKRYSEYKKLIQCQKEEIERLQSILLKFVREINIFENKHNIDTSDFSLIPILENEKNSIVKQIKAEGIKEFAERLKETANSRMLRKDVVYIEEIDNLVKEMAGDTE